MYFDSHSDIWYDVTNKRLHGESNVFDRYHLPKFQAGDVEGSFFVIWADPPGYDEGKSTPQDLAAVSCEAYAARTHQIMQAVSDEIAVCDSFRIVHNYDEMMQAKADGKIYIFIGVEGMAYVGEDLARIDEYYRFGAREGMLTWNEKNSLGAGASSGSAEGLTELGKAAVQRMEELGMIIDVSHLNEAGFWDVIDLAHSPVIASHSNASALCAHPRNLTDDQLRAIAGTGGVVGLNAYDRFIHSDLRKSDVGMLADHAMHMIDIMGINHVGCGFDFMDFFEGESEGHYTKGLHDCTEIYHLFEALAERGLSAQDLEKIAYQNFHRVIREVL